MLDIPSKLKSLQDALDLNDRDMADYLGVDVTGLREARGGTQDLSSHGVAILLDNLGFLKISDAVMAVLTKTARIKLVSALSRQALSISQKKALSNLKKRYEQDKLPDAATSWKEKDE